MSKYRQSLARRVEVTTATLSLALAALVSLGMVALSGCGQKGPLTLAAPAGRHATAVPAALLPASSVSPTALPASQAR